MLIEKLNWIENFCLVQYSTVILQILFQQNGHMLRHNGSHASLKQKLEIRDAQDKQRMLTLSFLGVNCKNLSCSCTAGIGLSHVSIEYRAISRRCITIDALKSKGIWTPSNTACIYKEVITRSRVFMEAVFCFQVSDVSANKIPQYMTQRFAVLSCKANSDVRLQILIPIRNQLTWQQLFLPS